MSDFFLRSSSRLFTEAAGLQLLPRSSRSAIGDSKLLTVSITSALCYSILKHHNVDGVVTLPHLVDCDRQYAVAGESRSQVIDVGSHPSSAINVAAPLPSVQFQPCAGLLVLLTTGGTSDALLQGRQSTRVLQRHRSDTLVTPEGNMPINAHTALTVKTASHQGPDLGTVSGESSPSGSNTRLSC